MESLSTLPYTAKDLQTLSKAHVCRLMHQKAMSYLPLRVFFSSTSQKPGSPGPQENTGIVCGIHVSMGPKNPKWVFCIQAKDPLIVRSKKHIEIVPPEKRQTKLFAMAAWVHTCYYNWDVEGRVSNQSCYRRSAYTNTIAETEGKKVYFRDIFPSCLRDLSQLENIAKFLNGGYVVPTPAVDSGSPPHTNPVNFVVDVTGRSSMPGRGLHDINPCAARKRKRSTWTRKRNRQTPETKESQDELQEYVTNLAPPSKYPKTIDAASLEKLTTFPDPLYAVKMLLTMKSSPPQPSPVSLVPYPLSPLSQ